ncbi:MAG TPA: calcium/sodium antiporter [Bacteroidia bacterium]|nr:calcium/sodium antiporter [Bacteroidia bacterium]HRD37882.1 calcium/sodium antiporter [Bacteroidia bacterium]
MSVFLITIGLIGLWLGTKWVINAALGIANLFKLSHGFVGVAILAVGTDLPEVFVTLKASLLQLSGVESSGIITGNAIGSSISQITVILGIAALLLTFKMPKSELILNGIFLLLSVALVYVFGHDGNITRVEGILLIITYLLYYYLLLRNNKDEAAAENEGAPDSIPKIILLLIAGLIVLIGSSHLVVENAMELAKAWGVEQSFVGIAVIGLGTSLPELAVSIGAAMKKSAAMSVGNVIGSNIFDGLIPIGLGASITDVKLESEFLRIDLPILFFSSLLVIVFLMTKKGMSRLEGIVLILIYLAYIILKMYN